MVALTAGQGGGADPVAFPQEGGPPARHVQWSAPEFLNVARLRCRSMTGRASPLRSTAIPETFRALTAHER